MSGLIQRAKVKPATWRVGRVGAVVLWPRAKAGCAAMLTANAAVAQKASGADLLIQYIPLLHPFPSKSASEANRVCQQCLSHIWRLSTYKILQSVLRGNRRSRQPAVHFLDAANRAVVCNARKFHQISADYR